MTSIGTSGGTPGRFRHRFEPTGTERRQLRKALKVARLCHRARDARRKEQEFGPGAPATVSDLVQFCWQVQIVLLMARPYRAGWQAHYNAACFYALLPQADQEGVGSGRIRRRALRHLTRAIDTPGQALRCLWVRDEDPDLKAVRNRSPYRFARAIGRLCPKEMVVHYVLAEEDKDPPACLRARGGAVADADRAPIEANLVDDREWTYRVPVFDETQPLRLKLEDESAPWIWSVRPSRVIWDEVWLVGTGLIYI